MEAVTGVRQVQLALLLTESGAQFVVAGGTARLLRGESHRPRDLDLLLRRAKRGRTLQVMHPRQATLRGSRSLTARLVILASTVALTSSVSVTLTSCTSPDASGCGTGGSCALTLPVPTSTDAVHTDGQLTGLVGTLTTSSRGGRLCVQLIQDDGPAVALVLPPGTSAAVSSTTPPDGPLPVTLIGANGLGGTRSGDRVSVTPDKRRQSQTVGGCPTGPTASVGWLIKLPTPTPTPTPSN